MNAVEIGQKLKRLRGTRTIKEVADATGISQSTLGMYEIGARVPRDNNKVTLAQYYATTVEELFYNQAITNCDR